MNEIIVSLDDIDRDQALHLAGVLSGKVWGFKVNDMLVEYGTEIVNALKHYGHVFADPKFYDIPNTVRNGVKRLSLAGADIISVHVSGGLAMLKAAKEVAKTSKIVGITMLTSLKDYEIQSIYSDRPLGIFSRLVKESGIDGVVCAGCDVPFWNFFDHSLKVVVPGIRPFGSVKDDDQVSTTVRTDASYVVVGRPIVQSGDPVAVVEQIKELFTTGKIVV